MFGLSTERNRYSHLHQHRCRHRRPVIVDTVTSSSSNRQPVIVGIGTPSSSTSVPRHCRHRHPYTDVDATHPDTVVDCGTTTSSTPQPARDNETGISTPLSALASQHCCRRWHRYLDADVDVGTWHRCRHRKIDSGVNIDVNVPISTSLSTPASRCLCRCGHVDIIVDIDVVVPVNNDVECRCRHQRRRMYVYYYSDTEIARGECLRFTSYRCDSGI